MRRMERNQIEALWTPLHWLTVLAVQGSFTAAAQRLGISKAAMSQRISELERAAGVALVRRTTRSVQLTEAGALLVQRTQGAFQEIATSFAGVKDLANTPSGRLRVTAPVAFARQQLIHRIPAFMAAYPAVRIELEMSDEIRSLSRDGFDIAIRHTSAPPETHVAWTLARSESVLVASRSYLKARGTPAGPDALAAHECLFYPRGHAATTWTFRKRNAPKSRAARNEVRAVQVGGRFAVNNSEALRDAAAEGLGIALLPDFSAQSALGTGKLVRVLPDWEPVDAFGSFLYAVRPYSAHVPRAAAVFVDYLKHQYAGGFL